MTLWEQSLLEELQPVEGTHTEAAHKELQPVGRADIAEFMEDCLL